MFVNYKEDESERVDDLGKDASSEEIDWDDMDVDIEGESD